MFLILRYSKKVSKKPSTNEGLYDLYLKTVQGYSVSEEVGSIRKFVNPPASK